LPIIGAEEADTFQ